MDTSFQHHFKFKSFYCLKFNSSGDEEILQVCIMESFNLFQCVCKIESLVFNILWQGTLQSRINVFKKAWGLSDTSLWLKNLNKRESLFTACYSITSLQSQPASSPCSSYLSPPFQREVNKQVVRHISLSVLRALPTTRLKGLQPLCAAVHRDVMLIMILTESERDFFSFCSNISS